MTGEKEAGTSLSGGKNRLKNGQILKSQGIHEKSNHLFRYPPAILSAGMAWKRLARIGLPVLFTLLVIVGLIFHARFSDIQAPSVQNGVLDLSDWNGEKTFEMTGAWEFYWDELLVAEQIKSGGYAPTLVAVPDKWNRYQIGDETLPSRGMATYRLHVTGAETGMQYGIRVSRMATDYRLYIDGMLAAKNDGLDGIHDMAYDYRSRIASFTSEEGGFDIVVQVKNELSGVGGMVDPLRFGTYAQIAEFDQMLFTTCVAAMSAIVISILFFLIFFTADHKERDNFILSILGVLVLLRISTIGDMTLIRIFPNMPAVWIDSIGSLTLPWLQFCLLYFIYCTYAGLVRRWQIAVPLAYAVFATLFVLLFPLRIVVATYPLMNGMALLTLLLAIWLLWRAAWQGRESAPLLLFVTLLILAFLCRYLLTSYHSIDYYLLGNSGILLFFAQIVVVAQRYRRAQKLEIAHLKGQIRPHFIHNALTSIISISRTEPDRARELLVDFSSYLRGFYDYERDELVSFAQELELVRAYAALEQARFGEKLRVEYRIEAEDFLLPSLVLQPLVENAFVHGLREKDNGGTVIVYTSRVKNGRVRMGVRDDGIGFSKKAALTRRGVGIENINRRLSRLYRTSLVYLVQEDGGCEVYLEIPYKEAAKHESMAD